MWRFLILLPFFSLHAEISALYLSWVDDPTTTMTIQWHTPEDQSGDTLFLQKDETTLEPFVGEHAQLEQTRIHKVTIRNLTPNTEYTFHINDDLTTYRFRTAPKDLNEPLRFVIGSDIYLNTKLFRRMSQTVLENRPQFIVLAGDITHSQSAHPFRTSPLKRMLAFLKSWKTHMITPDGLITPFLIIPGNKDISPDDYELFFTLFAQPKKQLYRAVDFGSYLSLILLDTASFQPIEGRQTLWLDQALQARENTPYRFAIYHKAAYPSHSSYHDIYPKKIRTHWVPLFEKHHILAAFENQDSSYKRTHPIKESHIDPSGVTYLGDNSWGGSPRKANNQWYLDKKGRKNSICLVEITPEKAQIEALDLFNTCLDTLTLIP
ncbi:MAG: hypothetical protein COT85_05030 [Chlamydiae bacterium CG10_big_fil_rev_8_21_14_0_10_42_34]|nr:MAG: hypothetical protein COT85_05030 [Chlamydiae bacterium CG10_big_fil_rev_8_21_14_0_10_42_34]